MAQRREFVLKNKELMKGARTHSILCLGKSNERVDNYVMIPIKKIGFIVIEHEIRVENNEQRS